MTFLHGAMRNVTDDEQCPYRMCCRLMSFFTVEHIAEHLDELESLTQGLQNTAPELVNAKIWLRLGKVIGVMRRGLTTEKRHAMRPLYDRLVNMDYVVETKLARPCFLFSLCVLYFASLHALRYDATRILEFVPMH